MTWFAIGLGFVIDVVLAILWFSKEIGGPLFFAGHIAVMLLVGWGILRFPFADVRKRRIRSVVVFAYAVTFFIPILGFMDGLLVVVFVWIVTNRLAVGVYDEYEEYILSRSQLTYLSTQDDFADIEREALFDPYVDILHRPGMDPRKSLLIRRIARGATPAGVALLRRALKDPLVEVQQFAASGLVRVEDAIQEEIQKAQDSVRQLGRARDYAHLGNLYANYAKLGLLDCHMANYYLGEAATAYRASLEIDPNQAVVYPRYVDVLMELGRMDGAKTLLEVAEAHGIESVDLAIARGRIDYYYGDLGRLIDRFKELDLVRCRPEQREVVEFWQIK